MKLGNNTIGKAPEFESDSEMILTQGLLNLQPSINIEVFNKIEKDYLYWDIVKYLKYNKLTVHEAWQNIKIKRQLNSKPQNKPNSPN